MGSCLMKRRSVENSLISRLSNLVTIHRRRPPYRVWFRHTGMELPDRWTYERTHEYALDELKRVTEGHKVTHMVIKSHIPPDIHLIAPELSHLSLSGITYNSDLSCMSKLNKLEVLDMSGNNFGSEGIPDIFTDMVALRELDISECRLTALPVSMSKLNKLEVLSMSRNNFGSEGIPDIFTDMVALRKLHISVCGLTTLPVSMKSLQHLQTLYISYNLFTTLPAVMCELKDLLTLNIHSNHSLVSLDAKILQLTQLRDLNIDECEALTYPPAEVCQRGLSAIRQYYTDLAEGEGQNLPLVTIAIIGNTKAGKTSLVKTLQSEERKRVLTNRDVDAVVDEATKVFNVEEVKVNDAVLRLIDMGGQDVYHITYQLTLKQNCIPIIVVNIQQYKELSVASSHREAVRRLAFDWLSHLYLSTPDLGPPKLVFTHKDKFFFTHVTELRETFLATAETLRKEIIEEEKQLGKHLTLMKHFSNTETPLFAPEDIYEVGDEEGDYTVYDSIKSNIFQASRKFVKTLPKLWEDVNDQVLSLQTAYSTVAEILAILHESGKSVTEEQLKTILNYMHDCGKVLHYEKTEALQRYIFHKIEVVTKLLTVLYHHGEEIWQERLEKFRPCVVMDHPVEKRHYEAFVSSFREGGVMDERLLRYLITSETAFQDYAAFKIAIILLQTFRLLHGPLPLQSKNCCIVPYFCSDYQQTWLENNEDVTLRMEILFQGLALPQYVYHQMVVDVLRMFPGSESSVEVKRNGVEVFHDSSLMHLIHDYQSRKVTLQVSSAVEVICQSWTNIVNITRRISGQVKETWPASRLVHEFLCPHCLLKGSSHPKRQVPPTWCDGYSSADPPTHGTQKGMLTVLCGKEKVPSPLLYPCYSLNIVETEKLKSVVKELKEERESVQPSTSSSVSEVETEKLKSVVEEWNGERASLLPSTNVEPRPPTSTIPLQRPKLQAAAAAEDELSDLSDDGEYLIPDNDPGKQMVSLAQRVVPTTLPKIQRLFHNTDKVFNMTKIRGRALIINNQTFPHSPERVGSEADVQNLEDMLKAFNFKVSIQANLSAEDILLVIKKEVKDKRHADYGTFWLFLCSHGTESNHIYGSDDVLVNLKDVYDLLTPLNFPGMAEKPKLVVIQACAGERVDGGEKGLHKAVPEDDSASRTTEEQLQVARPPRSEVGQRLAPQKMTALNYDNLLVIKSSFESFLSRRDPTYGSLMIRCLVRTIYRHACHRDMYEIYKIVQHRVRKFCIKKNLEGGQLVVAQDTLTHMRKLYLFPGYNGSRRRTTRDIDHEETTTDVVPKVTV